MTLTPVQAVHQGNSFLFIELPDASEVNELHSNPNPNPYPDPNPNPNPSPDPDPNPWP